MSCVCTGSVLLLTEVGADVPYSFSCNIDIFSNVALKFLIVSIVSLGTATFDGSSRYGADEETDTGSTVFVKYNRMLHGRKSNRAQKRDTLTIKFLKKYIHYAKHRIQPDLTDEVPPILHLFTA